MNTPDSIGWSSTSLAIAQPVRWRALIVKLCDADGQLPSAQAAHWAYFLWAEPSGDLRRQPPTEWGVTEIEPQAEIHTLVGEAPVEMASLQQVRLSSLLRMLLDIGDVPEALHAPLEARISEARAREMRPHRTDPAFQRFLHRLH